MKKGLLSILIIILFGQICLSQNTWVRTLHVAPIWATVNNRTSSVGPLAFTVNTDNSIVGIYQMSKDAEESIIKINSSGIKLWENHAAVSGGIYWEYCLDLYSTPDNGNIFRFIHQGGSVFNSIKKLNSNGNVQWFIERDILSGGGVFQKAIPTYYNTILIEVADSLLEYSLSGQLIRSKTPCSGLMATFPDSTFLTQNGDTIVREDFAGNIQWTSYLAPNSYYSKNDLSFAYFQKSDSLIKVDVSNGTTIWTKYLGRGQISLTSNGGFIRTKAGFRNIGELCRLDSSMNVIWTKNYSLPSYGFTQTKEISSNEILAGGGWESITDSYTNDTAFSPFIVMLDSNGTGNLDSTDYYFPGNANDNNIFGWGDDAVYVAAALNSSGIPRDLIIQTDAGWGRDVIGENWVLNFPGNINYKFSDVDGNGMIDTADVRKLSNATYTSPFNSLSHWQRETEVSSIPDLNFHYRNNHLNSGDTAFVDVVLGSGSIPADSIYGLSFETYLFSHMHGFIYWAQLSSHAYNSDLGDTSIDLFARSYFYPQYFGNYPFKVVQCRTDHSNRIVSGDTIVTLSFIANNAYPVLDTAYFTTNANAISAAGYHYPLNIVGDSLFIYANTTNIETNSSVMFSIYPNPANETLIIQSSKKIGTCKVYDQYGKLVDQFEQSENMHLLNVRNYAAGVYILTCTVGSNIFEKRFLVSH